MTTRLRQLRDLANQQAPVDSPLFDLLNEWELGNIARLKTDVFRDQVQMNEELKRRLAAIRETGKNKDYRDHATMLELAVLNDESERALEHLEDAVSVIREAWEPKSTADNLRMIERSRSTRGANTSWLTPIIEDLQMRVV